MCKRKRCLYKHCRYVDFFSVCVCVFRLPAHMIRNADRIFTGGLHRTFMGLHFHTKPERETSTNSTNTRERATFQMFIVHENILIRKVHWYTQSECFFVSSCFWSEFGHAQLDFVFSSGPFARTYSALRFFFLFLYTLLCNLTFRTTAAAALTHCIV